MIVRQVMVRTHEIVITWENLILHSFQILRHELGHNLGMTHVHPVHNGGKIHPHEWNCGHKV